jgi:hypothetical protein
MKEDEQARVNSQVSFATENADQNLSPEQMHRDVMDRLRR